DGVSRPQVLDQHDHEHRVHGAVETSSEDRPDVVARAPRQGKADADLAPVFGDVVDARPGASPGREQIEAPAHPARLPGFAHGPMLSSPGWSPDTWRCSRRASSKTAWKGSTRCFGPARSARAIAATTAWRGSSRRARPGKIPSFRRTRPTSGRSPASLARRERA